MSDFKIITDSTTDLTPELVEELDVHVIPMEFVFGDEVYHNYPDAREMSSPEFFRRLKNGEIAKTNQINTVTFLETFEPYLQEGKDVLYIGFSSALSGTFTRALEAIEELKKAYPERKILAADTLAYSMGEGLLVYYAVQEKKKGASIEQVAAWVNHHRHFLSQYFTVDDLFHLKRGGRLSGAAALMGTVLGIKPILSSDKDGHLVAVAKVRGRKQSLDTLAKKMAATIQDPEEQVVFVVHSDTPEDAKYLVRQIKDRVKVKKIVVNDLGPILGTHTGPGGTAIFYMGENSEKNAPSIS